MSENSQKSPKIPVEPELNPQATIETEMKKIVEYGNYEMAFLFSEEGLLLADACNSTETNRHEMIEVSLHFQELQKTTEILQNYIEMKEAVMEGEKGKKIILRFFQAFEQTVVLALIVPPRKAYRKFTNNMVRLIQRVSV
ncbi:hypothetical protein KAH55_09520 [bacterium]|nr:hypothetical protein [bacterium]